ncbi:EpsG family protein [Clostridium perfringens]|nr:EpsG family protein [Clostridium perfringens]
MTISIYIVEMIIASILGVIYQNLKDGRLKIVGIISYAISFLITWFISAIRFGIGTDYFMYKDIYEYAIHGATTSEIISWYDVEPGWAFLNRILGMLSKDTQVIFIVTSFIFIFCIYKAISDFKDDISVGMSIFIFLAIAYIPSFNVVRQYLAIGILMLSFKYIKDKKLIKFLTIVILASFFHYTALIFLPMYYLLNNNISTIKWVVIGTITILLFLNYNNFIEIMINFVPSFEKYSRYKSSGLLEINKTLLFLQFSMILIIFISKNFLKNKNIFIYRMTYIYYFSIIFSLLGNMVEFAGRASYYFDISQMFFIPAICRFGVKKTNKLIFNKIIIIYYIFYWYINFVYSSNNGCIPYMSILNIQ